MMQRITEIDLIRTIAIILMVIYHAAYDLRIFYAWQIDLFGPQWEAVRILTVSLFLIISGVSANFSRKPLRRALIVIGCAMLISAATFIYDPDTFIYFGILHCIGFGMLLLILLKRLKEWNILIGIAILRTTGAQLQFYPLSSILYPLINRPTLDFYPPVPWIGLMLIGAGIGHFLYVRHSVSTFQHLPAGRQISNISSLLTLPGRYALLIYLIHQPILLIALNLILR